MCKPLGFAAAHRVTAGRESLPNTARLRREAPMTAPAVAGASFLRLGDRLDTDDGGLCCVAEPGGPEWRGGATARHGCSLR